MPPAIFISYRRTDTGGHAGRLFDRLRDWFNTNELFFDVANLEAGNVFPEHIDQAIRGAKAVLVLVGPDWLKTLNGRATDSEVDFVRREVAIAIKRQEQGETVVLPVLVGQARMPSRKELHETLQDELGRLPDYQAHTFQGNQEDWDHQFDRLRQRLANIAGVPRPHYPLPFGTEQPHLTIDVPLKPDFRDIVPTRRSQSRFNRQAIEKSFGALSPALLDWPQETEGQWIERPELQRLHALASREKSAVTALLGPPGEGKSAILARLGKRLIREGVALLAIKADRIPRDVATLADLDSWVGCEIPVAEALRKLAYEQHVVVLIDQLDALADLMDRHSERLSVLLRLVNTLRDAPNMQVLVSCRDFEYRNDVRLNTLEAEEVSLERLSWEQVLPLLTAHGLQTDGWNEEVRDVLRTPQHLAMFIEHVAREKSVPAFETYQGLLNRIIKERLERVHGERTVEAAEDIATEMAKEEELWLARDRFDHKFDTELQNLEASGFLVSSENGLSLSFRHQTLFDFLRARAFLRDSESLAEYILNEKQESLFVRPVLWSGLNYLRGSDRAIYRQEFRRLWTHDGLRLHLRYLLIAFLGQVAAPDDEEAQWLLPVLESTTLRVRVLRAMVGNAGWFDRIRSRLPSLMMAPPDEAWGIVGHLADAVTIEQDVVLPLVERYWVPDIADRPYLAHASTVLCNLTSWDANSVDIAARIAARAHQDTFLVRRLVDKIAEARPDLAFKVIARCLHAKTRQVTATSPRPISGQSASDAPQKQHSTAYRYERLLEEDDSWYDIDKVAIQAPRAFVKEIWPWLIDLLERMAEEPIPWLNQYRQHNGLAFSPSGNGRHSLQKAIESSIRRFAETEPDAFLVFVESNLMFDLEALHHLLALGLERVAATQPKAVLRYLLEDPRRFAVGNMEDIHADSCALISAVAQALSDDDARLLERAIVEWKPLRAFPADRDPGDRFKLWKWTRMHRLRLLRSFPSTRLSSEGRRHLEEEERALPHTPNHDADAVGPKWVGSPMSAEQMAKATDDQIVSLFEELTDDTQWDHPKRKFDLVGGTIQASRAFAEFAKNAPDRALRIIQRFEAGTTECPAGAALAELGKSAVPPAMLIACIQDLDTRRFKSEHFRADAARCLRAIALRANGLDDTTCDLLERWIIDWHPEAARGEAEVVGHTGVPNESGEPRENGRSFLWGLHGAYGLPGGNYPFLDALMLGHLMRKPDDANGWLAVLERHLRRRENPEIWNTVAHDLHQLAGADRKRATAFLESLLSLRPEVLRTTAGVLLIARIQDWLPEELLGQIVDRWISQGWANGPQAAGEVMALRLCRNPDEPETRERIERFLADGEYEPTVAAGLRLGVAHTLVAAWNDPVLRALTTPLLVRLVSITNGSLAEAFHSIFTKSDAFPADGHTSELLGALLEHPSILLGGRKFLIDELKGLLREGWNPKLVYEVANSIVGEADSAPCDFRTSLSGIAGDLADIALTLHRLPETRTCGLDLFEQLMEVDAYQLDQCLTMIDRPAFR